MKPRWPEGIPEPCIPRRSDTTPSGPNWIHEIKYDGYRLMVARDGDVTRVITRGGHDWTARYPLIAATARTLPARSFVLDGEGVVEGDGGIADFALLHSRKHDRACYLIAFDLLGLDGLDLRSLPLSNRKLRLARLLKGSVRGIVYGDHIEGDGPAVFAAACKLGHEGIVSKHKGRPYRAGPSAAWIKIKNPDAPWKNRLEEG